MTGGRLRLLDAPPPGRLPEAPEDFLRILGGPALLRVAGRDRGRARAVATLLHGNEPSGLRAVLAWLRAGVRPATDAWLFVLGVEAALAPPEWTRRVRPGGRDLNRCFLGPWDDADGALAGEVLERLEVLGPEALIDVHNNSGRNPPYGVSPRAGAAELALTARFAERQVQSRLRLGALVEATAERFPSVVVEVGRAGDPAADAVARRGLARFLEDDPLWRPDRAPPRVTLLVDPVRVCVRPGVRVAYAGEPDASVDLTVQGDADRHNFARLPPGEPLGWVRAGAPWPLEARGADGRDHSRDLFALEDGELRTRRGLVPIMMTTDPEIARADCLFYAVRPDDAPPTRE